MNTENTYLIVSLKSWNHEIFKSQISKFHGNWHLLTEKKTLTIEFVKKLDPRYIFFLHWSFYVPDEITEKYECINFHITDLPYGRGGSPLQNLIVRGHTITKLSALRMNSELDAGPIYMKRDLSLEGAAKEIFSRAAALEAEMIREIIRIEPDATPQVGEPVVFERRVPAQSRLSEENSLKEVYDKIRMLDGEGYPPAFVEDREFRYEFSDARLEDGHVVADVKITLKGKG